jgi:membrane protein implicated in regulation of membrane protease activity
VSGEGRAPGWYPDPWGTPEERYFDGVAWARTTRRTGGSDAAPLAPLATPGAYVAASPTAVPGTEPAALTTQPVATPADGPAAVPPGWHPDPWALAALRYWDGNEWTGHVSGAPGVAPVPAAEERNASRWAKVGLACAGPAVGIGAIGMAFWVHWVADHWDALTREGSTTDQSGNSGAAIVIQLSLVVAVVGAVLFLLWFHRSATIAAQRGLRPRRAPGLATASFFIPVLNLWWPYQSTLDLLPARHPARHLVRRWWLLWLGCLVGVVAVCFSATLNAVALAVVTAATVVLAIMAAMTARTVVSEITEAHDQLLAGV